MDLATLAQIKTYATDLTNVDPLITALIPRASAQIRRYLSRSIPNATFTNQRLTGSGTVRLQLPEWPVISVARVNIAPLGDAASDLVASDGVKQGYLFDQYGLALVGGIRFPPEALRTIVSWTCGYQASETGVVPTTGNARTLTPTTGNAALGDGTVSAADSVGVVYTANSVALARVTGAPGAGQYSFDVTTGVYTFNSADQNQSVTMTYWYVPPDIVQAMAELIMLKIKQKAKIGITSESLKDQHVTFYTQADMTKSIQGMLESYRKVFPI